MDDDPNFSALLEEPLSDNDHDVLASSEDLNSTSSDTENSVKHDVPALISRAHTIAPIEMESEISALVKSAWRAQGEPKAKLSTTAIEEMTQITLHRLQVRLCVLDVIA